MESLKTNPYYDESQDALYLEGMAYMGLEDYESAIVCFEKALECADSDEVAADLAVCYAKNGNESKALRVLDKLNPTKDFVRYIEAEIFHKKGNYQEAESGFRDAIDLTKDDNLKLKAYIELARLYKERRHEDKDTYYYLNKQIDIMEEAVRELGFEDDLTLTEMMAEAYFTAREYELSVIKFSRLLELGYDRAYIYRNIAIIHQQTDNLEAAEEVLLEMKKKYPEDSTCYIQLAFVYMDMESRKPQSSRNYYKVVENYELAKKYSTSDNQSELVQLERSIDELKRKGWIK